MLKKKIRKLREENPATLSPIEIIDRFMSGGSYEFGRIRDFGEKLEMLDYSITCNYSDAILEASLYLQVCLIF